MTYPRYVALLEGERMLNEHLRVAQEAVDYQPIKRHTPWIRNTELWQNLIKK